MQGLKPTFHKISQHGLAQPGLNYVRLTQQIKLLSCEVDLGWPCVKIMYPHAFHILGCCFGVVEVCKMVGHQAIVVFLRLFQLFAFMFKRNVAISRMKHDKRRRAASRRRLGSCLQMRRRRNITLWHHRCSVLPIACRDKYLDQGKKWKLEGHFCYWQFYRWSCCGPITQDAVEFLKERTGFLLVPEWFLLSWAFCYFAWAVSFFLLSECGFVRIFVIQFFAIISKMASCMCTHEYLFWLARHLSCVSK